MGNVVTCGLNESFLKFLSGYIDSNYLKKGSDLTRVAFVFEGKRPSLFLKRMLAGKNKTGFFPPRFFSIDEFVEYTLSKKTPFSKMPAMESCYTIFTLAGEIAPEIVKGREEFSKFLPWAREIVSFIDTLDIEDIPSHALKDVQASASIGYEIPDNINASLAHIIKLRERYHEVMAGTNSFSKGYIYLSASRAAKEVDLEEFDAIYFCGFFYMQKTQRSIAKHLFESGKANFFFQGHEKEWPVLKETARDLSCSIKPSGNSAASSTGRTGSSLKLYSAFDRHSEVCTVREILKGVKKLNSTVIVLPDPNSMIPLVSEIGSLSKDFNVSLGYPLRRSSLYALFDFIVQAQKTRKGGKYYAKDYIACMSQPLVKNLRILDSYSATRILVHKVEEALLGIEETPLNNRLFVGLKEIENEPALLEAASSTLKHMDIDLKPSELKKVLEGLHSALFVPWEDLSDFQGFAGSLGSLLDVLVYKSLMREYGLNLKIAEKMYTVRDELESSPFAKEKFTKEDMFKIFQNMVENEVAPFSGSPLKGLQVLGPFETRSLNFENVIIMDANESALPRLRLKEPLIPHDVSLGLGLKIIENEEEIQRYQFKRLIAGAKNVHLVYQENPVKQKSRFVEEIIWQLQKEKKSLDAVSAQQVSFSVNVLSSGIEIKKTPEMLDMLKNFRYSASSVDTYVKCPLQFYYKHVLGLEEKKEFPEDPEGREIGTFLHGLLQETFRVFLNKKPVIDGRFREAFFKKFRERFKNTFGRRMRSDSFLLEDVMKFRLERFLDAESGSEERRVKEILSLENPLQKVIGLSGDKFDFKYIVDRIDRLDDGSILILDYKSGADTLKPQRTETLEKMEFSRESIRDRIRSFQLPIYYHLEKRTYQDDTLNAALYSLRNLKLTYLDDDNTDLERTMEICMKALDYIIHELLDPKVPFAADREKERSCTYCPFFYLCR
ncbi:MAG: PD-(D/E)XK nuclease family protein [Candidatus Omnitrophica bacterium]|nr:PD-(D/E)XK nuclease family protein [Candidatus Omnitrophota bacterium]